MAIHLFVSFEFVLELSLFSSCSFLSLHFFYSKAADGKAPIAAVEEEDDDVPGESGHTAQHTLRCWADNAAIKGKISCCFCF